MGYKGRMSVVEVLSINEAIRQMIIKQVSSNEIKTRAIQAHWVAPRSALASTLITRNR